LLLKLLNRMAQRRLGQIESIGSRRQRTTPIHFPDNLKVIPLNHRRP
jgi:hypothetical protein